MSHFSNHLHAERQLFRRRVIIIAAVVICLMLILLARLVYLQVVRHHYYSTAAAGNSINLVPIEPSRGLIYDHSGRILAQNIPVYSLDITPNRSANLTNTVKQLQNLLSISDDDIKRFYRQRNQHRNFDDIPLKIKLTPAEVARFSVNQYRFPSAKITARLIRYYPFRDDMVDILGYAGRINLQELTHLTDPGNYAASNYIGKLGIERYYEAQLHGKVGYQQVEINASGQTVRTLKRITPKSGDSLYLTVDAQLQEAAVQAMRGHRGAVVAIDTHNGNILAMVSSPSYDPNLFVRGINHKDYQLLRNNPGQPLFNRAARGQYPLGSTIKPFLALQGLANKTVTANFQIYDPGYFQINAKSRRYRNWQPNGQGWIDVRSAISQSCDTYFYWLASKMGIRPIEAIMKAFGFGQRTGIQIKEELPGLVPSPEVKKARTNLPWYTGDTLNTSIGQGMTLATPVQLAAATAIIANRGIYYKPNLITKIQHADGSIVIHTPKQGAKIDLPSQVWNPIIRGMMDVITAKLGTGYRFGEPTYTVAAKTGTAQLFDVKENETYNEKNVAERLRDNSMFMAFAPVKHPHIAIAVAIQNDPAAPHIARLVMDYYLLTEKHLSDK